MFSIDSSTELALSNNSLLFLYISNIDVNNGINDSIIFSFSLLISISFPHSNIPIIFSLSFFLII